MILTETIIFAVFVYLAIGILFAVWFVVFGIAKLDESAKATSFGFRLIIFFGAALFWVLLAKRLLLSETIPTENNEHRHKSLEAK